MTEDRRSEAVAEIEIQEERELPLHQPKFV